MNYLINVEFQIQRTAGLTDHVAAAKVSVKDPVRHKRHPPFFASILSRSPPFFLDSG